MAAAVPGEGRADRLSYHRDRALKRFLGWRGKVVRLASSYNVVFVVTSPQRHDAPRRFPHDAVNSCIPSSSGCVRYHNISMRGVRISALYGCNGPWTYDAIMR